MPLVARIEADHMVAGGKDHALHALAFRRFEQVIGADDVGVEDRLPLAFDGEGTEMDNARPCQRQPVLDCAKIGKVGCARISLPGADPWAL